jgi:AcrR family transcriptional regulator
MSNTAAKRSPGRPKGSRNKPRNAERPLAGPRQKTIEKRARIVDAAIQSVAESGVQHSTLGEIAERAGTTRGGIEHYFATAEALFMAARIEARPALLSVNSAQMGIKELLLWITADPQLCALWRLEPDTRSANFGPLFGAAVENAVIGVPNVREASIALDLELLRGLLADDGVRELDDLTKRVIEIHARSREAYVERD